jgi:hypothetical protein
MVAEVQRLQKELAAQQEVTSAVTKVREQELLSPLPPCTWTSNVAFRDMLLLLHDVIELLSGLGIPL